MFYSLKILDCLFRYSCTHYYFNIDKWLMSDINVINRVKIVKIYKIWMIDR